MRIPNLRHSRDRPVLDVGWYLTEIVACQKRISRWGRTYLTFEFEVVEYPNKRIIDYFPLVDDALWKLKAFVLEAGGDPEGGFDAETLLGRRLYVRIGHEKYKGQLRDKIRQYAAVPG